jgi:hypothetical protein
MAFTSIINKKILWAFLPKSTDVPGNQTTCRMMYGSELNRMVILQVGTPRFFITKARFQSRVVEKVTRKYIIFLRPILHNLLMYDSLGLQLSVPSEEALSQSHFTSNI